MRKSYLILIIIAVWQIGCETEANSNKPNNLAALTNEKVQNSNQQNLNANSNTESKDEEVPTFDDAEKALEKGIEYLDKNKTKKAIEALKQSTKLDPDIPDAHFRLGIAFALEESEDEAKIKPAEIDETPTPKKKPKKEKKRNSIKSFENAVKAYKKFIRKNPKDGEANFNLGRAYNKLGSEKDKDARKALERAVRLDDKNSLYRTELAAVLIELAKYPDAIRQLKKAVEIDEDNVRAEDLLVKAKAGKKRTNFKKKEKK